MKEVGRQDSGTTVEEAGRSLLAGNTVTRSTSGESSPLSCSSWCSDSLPGSMICGSVSSGRVMRSSSLLSGSISSDLLDGAGEKAHSFMNVLYSSS